MCASPTAQPCAFATSETLGDAAVVQCNQAVNNILRAPSRLRHDAPNSRKLIDDSRSVSCNGLSTPADVQKAVTDSFRTGHALPLTFVRFLCPRLGPVGYPERHAIRIARGRRRGKSASLNSPGSQIRRTIAMSALCPLSQRVRVFAQCAAWKASRRCPIKAARWQRPVLFRVQSSATNSPLPRTRAKAALFLGYSLASNCPRGRRTLSTRASGSTGAGIQTDLLMSDFDPATVRRAVMEFTPRRPQRFQDLAPAREFFVELQQKRASYRAIAELLTQHLPANKEDGHCIIIGLFPSDASTLFVSIFLNEAFPDVH
jgi:hypothetical protein